MVRLYSFPMWNLYPKMVVTMSMEDFYEVGNTGMFFGNGHKGGFSIVFKESKYFFCDWRIDGCTDCIKGVYEAIELAPLKEEHEDSFLLRYEWLIRETAKKVWDTMSYDYIIPKCFGCTLKRSASGKCDCWGDNWSWTEYSTVEENYPPFDLHKYYEKVDVMLRSGY